MATSGRGERADVDVQFDAGVWEQEVERLGTGSPMHAAAVAARRAIERDRGAAEWLRCEAEGAGGIRLPRCVKTYVPLGREPSAAPYGFVFELAAEKEPRPALGVRLLAFGERHPERPGTRSVYERAHRRLHGRYPDK